MSKPNDNGAKHLDDGKLPLHLISRSGEAGLARVLAYGNEKYPDDENGAWNWYRGMNWSRLIGSLRRHLAAFSAGEDIDAESGELHIDHVQACAHFLSTYQHEGRGVDDRVRQGVTAPHDEGEGCSFIYSVDHEARRVTVTRVEEEDDPEFKPEFEMLSKNTPDPPAPLWRAETNAVTGERIWVRSSPGGTLYFDAGTQSWWFKFADRIMDTSCFPVDEAKKWVAALSELRD